MDVNLLGPDSSTDNALAVFNGPTGHLIKNSTIVPTAAGIAMVNAADAAAQKALLPADVVEWPDVQNKPSTFPPSTHNHDASYSALGHDHAGTYEAANANIQAHIASTSNPHTVTKAQVGLGNVDNTSDANKPVSSAQQTALDGKAATSHNHDGSYSALTHNHDANYSALGHNHDASYSALGHNHAGVYEPANANIQAHVVAAHAPANAQANADITKAEIEAKLTGVISTHSHTVGGGSAAPIQYNLVNQTAWTNKPNALNEFLATAHRRLSVALANAVDFRIVMGVQTQGAAASVTGIQYSTDGGTTWRGLDNGTSGANSTVTVADLGTGIKTSAWTALAAGAKTDVLVRVAGSGGDGALDPLFTYIGIQLR